MVSTMDKVTIIKLWVEGKSIRSIAKALGISKNTAKKYVRDFEDAKKGIEAAGDPIDQAQIQRIAFEEPKMDTEGRKAKIFAGELEKRFNELCEQDERRDSVLGESHKQRLNAAVLHRELVSEGFKISERTVRNRLAERRKQIPEVFIRQCYEYGERADFDFHQEKVVIAGKKTTIHQATISCPKSNHVYVALFPNEKTASVEEALMGFFEECGGVFGEIAFDNLSPVVSKIGRSRAEKVFTDEMLRFSAYYGFEINACNPRSGNEKGHVENSGKWVRPGLFSLRYEFGSWDELIAYKDERMKAVNARTDAEFAMEKASLRPLPKRRYVSADFGRAKANSYSLVSIRCNFYSVPEDYAKTELEWEIVGKAVAITSRGTVVARHPLLEGKGGYSVEIRHYLKTLRRKPGALGRSLALKQSDPALLRLYRKQYRNDPAGFVDLIAGKSEKTDQGERIADASIAQLKRISEGVVVR